MADELAALSKTQYVSPIYNAEIYLGLGDRERVMVFLEKGFADRSDIMPQLKFEPEFDLMREDARFQALYVVRTLRLAAWREGAGADLSTAYGTGSGGGGSSLSARARSSGFRSAQ